MVKKGIKKSTYDMSTFEQWEENAFQRGFTSFALWPSDDFWSSSYTNFLFYLLLMLTSDYRRSSPRLTLLPTQTFNKQG